MKYKYLLVFLLFSLNSLAQEYEQLGWGVGEIYIGTRGLNEYEKVSYKMDVVGSLWARGNVQHEFILNPTNPSLKSAKASRGLDSLFSNTDFTTYNFAFF